jgi:hypothetical protein
MSGDNIVAENTTKLLIKDEVLSSVNKKKSAYEEQKTLLSTAVSLDSERKYK